MGLVIVFHIEWKILIKCSILVWKYSIQGNHNEYDVLLFLQGALEDGLSELLYFWTVKTNEGEFGPVRSYG